MYRGKSERAEHMTCPLISETTCIETLQIHPQQLNKNSVFIQQTHSFRPQRLKYAGNIWWSIYIFIWTSAGVVLDSEKCWRESWDIFVSCLNSHWTLLYITKWSIMKNNQLKDHIIAHALPILKCFLKHSPGFCRQNTNAKPILR